MAREWLGSAPWSSGRALESWSDVELLHSLMVETEFLYRSGMFSGRVERYSIVRLVRAAEEAGRRWSGATGAKVQTKQGVERCCDANGVAQASK